MQTARKGEAGFTLLEVLIAFVILTMVVTLCLQVYSSSARTENAARWSETAYTLLRDRLASFETMNLQPGSQAQGVAADGMRWTVAAGQPAGPGSERDVVWLTAVVTDPAGRTYTASTARWLGESFTAVTP
jgi:Tfp pilus assembly protein PilV